MSATRLEPKDDLIGCPCTGATLDKLIQPAILAVLADGPIHGYGLAERLGVMPAFAGEKPDVSGVYRFLKAMERRGLVSSSWDLSENGPAKKTYAITAAGRRLFASLGANLGTVPQNHHRVAEHGSPGGQGVNRRACDGFFSQVFSLRTPVVPA